MRDDDERITLIHSGSNGYIQVKYTLSIVQTNPF